MLTPTFSSLAATSSHTALCGVPLPTCCPCPNPNGVDRTWQLPWKTQLPAVQAHPIRDVLTQKQVKHLVHACQVTQSCLTLCNPMDCSLPGSSVHGIFQARLWNGLPFPPPRDLPNPGIGR